MFNTHSGLYAVEVRVPLASGKSRRASGYVISPRRILTALHVVIGENPVLSGGRVEEPSLVEIRTQGDFISRFPNVAQASVERAYKYVQEIAKGDFLWRPARLIWPPIGSSTPTLDLAVLEVDAEHALPYVDHPDQVRCWYPSGDVECRGTGYPKWADAQAGGADLANPTTVKAILSEGAARYGGLHSATVTSGAPQKQEEWKSLSGTAFFDDRSGRLVGIASQIQPSADNNVLRLTRLAEAADRSEFDDFWTATTLARPTRPLMSGLSTGRFTGKLQEFVDEYIPVDDATRVVPFGGRDDEFRVLDEWLERRGGSNRLLISAPAGRGKSALVVHWLQRLKIQERIAEGDNTTFSQKWNLVFCPISIRVGTNPPVIFYRILATRLSEILDISLEMVPTRTEEEYHDSVVALMSEAYTRRTPVLIVIDGVDEALGMNFDGAMFSHRRDDHVKIVVAARWVENDFDGSGWMGRLDWEPPDSVTRVELSKLNVSAIEQVLRGIGEPFSDLSEKGWLIQKLFDLTEGEPLLVRYYAEDLSRHGDASSRIKPDDLQQLTPGFRSYFDDWIKWQSKAWEAERRLGADITVPMLDRVLLVLSCAYGPLKTDDLASLIERIFKIDLGPSIQWLLRPLARFMMGSSEGGYVLSHPRVGSYLRNERFRETQVRSTLFGFVDWGKEVLSDLKGGRLAYERVPQYLVQFHISHLNETGSAPEEYVNIVEEGWLRACEAREGSHYRYFNDVKVALRVCAREDSELDRRLAAIVRCVLCLCSIKSAAIPVPPRLLINAVDRGLIRPVTALGLIRMQHSPLVAIAGIAPHIDISDRLDLVRDALAKLRRTKKDSRKAAHEITILAPLLTEDLAVEALALLGPSEEEDQKQFQFIANGDLLTPESYVTSLRIVERRLETWDDWMRKERAIALATLADHLPIHQRDEAIHEVVSYIKKLLAQPVVDIWNFSDILYHLPYGERAIWWQASVKKITDNGRYDNVEELRFLSANLSEDQAKELLSALPKELLLDFADFRIKLGGVLLNIATYLSQNERSAALLKVSELLLDDVVFNCSEEVDKFNGSTELSRLASAFADSPRQEKVAEAAFCLAARIVNKKDRCRCLGQILPGMTARLRIDVEQAFRELLYTLSWPNDAGEILDGVASNLSDTAITDFLSQMRRSGDERERTVALSKLAQLLPGTSGIAAVREALKSARARRDAKERTQALAEIASAMRGDEQTAILIEAVDALCKTDPDWHRLEALEALAPLLRGELLNRAAESACQIESDFELSRALPLLMPHAGSDLRKSLTLTAVAIEDGGLRARALKNMISEIPDELSGTILEVARQFLKHSRELEEFDALDIEQMIRRADLGQAPKRPHWTQHGMDDAALQLLRDLWRRRPELLDPDEVKLLAANIEDASAPRSISNVILLPQDARAALEKILSDPDDDEQDRIRNLTYLIPKLPREVILDAIDVAYQAGGPTLIRALDSLAVAISSESDPRSFAMLFRQADRLSRGEFYSLLSKLYDGLAMVGNETTLNDVQRAIIDTAEWFP